MTYTALQIEQVTQCVLRELRSRGIEVSSARENRAARPLSDMPDAPPRGTESDLLINERVITEAVLEQASAAGRTVALSAGAVITPSARDYIRRNTVILNDNTQIMALTRAGILIVLGELTAATTAARAAAWSCVSADCDPDAAAKAVREATDRPVVCCGGDPSVTACLINRDSRLRAAVVSAATDLDLLYSRMNPHVVCVEARGWSFAALRSLLWRMSTQTPDIPGSWKELAGGQQ